MIRKSPIKQNPFVVASVMACLLLGHAAVSEPGAASSEKRPAAAVNRDLSSPRATVNTFYAAMKSVEAEHSERMADAIACLDLEEIEPADRVERGTELARRLYQILDLVTFAVEDIPVTVEGDTCKVELGDGGELVLAFRRKEAGAWCFSYSQTLKKLGAIEESVEARAQEEEGVKEEFDPDFPHPRATMETFINGINAWREGGLEDAISTMDMSGLGKEVREEKGLEWAVLLKRIIDRHAYVDYLKIHNDPKGPKYVFLQHPAGNIVIAPVEDAETGLIAWKFTAKTLETLKPLYREFKDRPPVTGVQDTTPALFSLWLWDRIDDHAPFLLRETVMLENWQWLGLLLIIIAGMLVSRVIAFLPILALRRWFLRASVTLDTALEKNFVRPIRIALMSWVWLLGLAFLGLPANVLFYLRVGAKSITVVGIAWAAYRLVDIVGQYLAVKALRSKNKFDDLLVPLLTRSLKVFVVVFGVVFIADTLELDYKGVLAGLGIGGLAFALAARDTVSNIFGSVTILLDRPFQIGDWVRIGDIDGSVESVGIRSTRVRTFYNSLISVPNGQLITATVDNMGCRTYRRIKCMISITYDTSPAKIDAFCEGIRELIRRHPYTRKDYYHVYFNEFGPSSLDILLYCFLKTPDWPTELRERHRLFVDIVRLAGRLNVEFAFPTQTLYMRGDATPSDGNEALPKEFDGAVRLGREEARKIVTETLGDDGEVPPPVSFENPASRDRSVGEEQAD